MISIAKDKFNKKYPNTDFIVGDINELETENKFDIILCYSCFPHFLDQEFTVRKLSEKLKEGAKLMIAHSQSREFINNLHKNIDGIVSKDRLPSMKKLIKMFKGGGLKILETRDNEEIFYIIGKKSHYSSKKTS